MASALALPMPVSSCCSVRASAVFRFNRLDWVWAWLTTGIGSFGKLAGVGAALRLKDKPANSGSSNFVTMDLRIGDHSCEVRLNTAAPWLPFQTSGSQVIRPVPLAEQ